MPPIIQISDLHHTYMADTPLAKTSLRGVSLHVDRGEVVSVIGSTGSGKSTLLQHMNGLIRPQRGQVWVNGQDLAHHRTDLRRIRRMVGLAFQRPGDQLFEQYVGDDIAYGPRLAEMQKPELRERVRWTMEQVGLDFEGYRDRLTSSLSGGERRKVGLAGVLAMRPQVLLLDEPTSGLDPAAHTEILRRLSRFHQEGMTVVFATHNMDDVALLAHRVYALHEGQVMLEGTPSQVFSHREQLCAIGLGVPAVVAVMDRLRDRGLDVPTDVLTLDKAERAIVNALARREATGE
jgi:energy-coupling factor transport system ATP-binding protein